MHNIILSPVISEKSMDHANKGTFTFLVANDATKKDIAKAVEKLFGVKVTKVAVAVVKGKTKRTGMRRIEVVASPMKKAYVSLKEGQKIEAFELGA